jgi:hypothetical protein
MTAELINQEQIDVVMRQEYLGIGAIGKFAIASMWDDFVDNRFKDGILQDQEVTIPEIGLCLCRLTEEIIRFGRLEQIMNCDGQWVER